MKTKWKRILYIQQVPNHAIRATPVRHNISEKGNNDKIWREDNDRWDIFNLAIAWVDLLKSVTNF